MFEPLVKLILTKLDLAVDWYLQRQKTVVLLVIPGTLLFLVLFVMFTGKGGAMVILGTLLAIVEAVVVIGLFLIQQHYQDFVRQRVEIADAIDAHVGDADDFGEWKAFLETPLEDEQLEQIRRQCLDLPSQLGPESVEALEALAAELRQGIATRFLHDFKKWRAARRARKSGEEPTRDETPGPTVSLTARAAMRARQEQVASAVKHLPAMTGSPMLPDAARKLVEKEAAREAKRAEKEAQRDEKKAARGIKKETKKGIKAARKANKQVLKQERNQSGAWEAEDYPQAPPAPRAPIGPADYSPSTDEPQYADEPVVVTLEATPRPAVYKEQPVVKGLSEAAAIQQVMRSGFTAHHYDTMQHHLARSFGRDPIPAEVVKALMNEQRHRKRTARSRPTKRAKRTARSPQPRAMRNAGTGMSTDAYVLPAGGSRRTGVRVMFLLAVLGGTPFLAWRVPAPNSEKKVIVGEVHHQVLDEAPDVRHRIRTEFEGFFGNKAVNITDGPRLYVNEADYDLCWPEPWDQIYAKGYTLEITAEAQPLLLGGYAVARITDVRRIDKPLANAR